MIDPVELRLERLTRMSRHYRELAWGLFPAKVSHEVNALADLYDDIVAEMNRECLGRRTCPCEARPSCLPLPGEAPVRQNPTAPLESSPAH